MSKNTNQLFKLAWFLQNNKLKTKRMNTMLCREDLIYFGAMMLLSSAMISHYHVPPEEDCVKKAEEMFDLIFNKDE